MSEEVVMEVCRDLEWVNGKYKEINFKESAEGDFILKALCNGKPAGLGRLVRVDQSNGELGGIYVFPEFRGKKIAEVIVSTLIQNNPYVNLWCIPFEPLENFYRKFGFTGVTSQEVPSEISEKVTWCEGRYPDPAILLVRTL